MSMKVTKEQFIGVTYDELLAENAKLREERDCWKKLCTDQEVMHVMREEMLDNENDRLWKQVDYMTPIAWYAASERERARMRELGIEVD